MSEKRKETFVYSSPWGEIPFGCKREEWDCIRCWMDDYCEGKRPRWRPEITPEGTEFQRKVWRVVSEIGYGETMTYGEVAKRIAPKMSAQAVGQAVNRNPYPIVVPCHRVVARKGGLGGYAFGEEVKKRLLDFERREGRENHAQI